jgi:hypothetical protein
VVGGKFHICARLSCYGKGSDLDVFRMLRNYFCIYGQAAGLGSTALGRRVLIPGLEAKIVEADKLP